MLRDFISLIYPAVCAGCNVSLVKQEQCICASCRYHIPRTGYHLIRDNPVMKLFLGRVDIVSATSFFEFAKNSRVQRMVHRLKYEGKKQVGAEIGRMYGKELVSSPLFSDAEVIIPVPLHSAKLRRRGYNQSGVFAKGIAEAMGRPVREDVLTRRVSSTSQTIKSRYERWKNVEHIFLVNETVEMENKHVLLVDDVVTTGSTIEACVMQLKKIPEIKISVAAIAYAPL